jgi:hypothetical protein
MANILPVVCKAIHVTLQSPEIMSLGVPDMLDLKHQVQWVLSLVSVTRSLRENARVIHFTVGESAFVSLIG